MNNSILGEIYSRHHQHAERENFAFYEKQRGNVVSKAIGRNKIVLDLGCRDGTLTKYFYRGNRVVGVDVDSRLLARCRSRLKIATVLFDLNRRVWPFARREFDVVMAGEILEHLFFPEEVILKIKSVLRPDGQFIGSVPNSFHILDRIGFAFGKIPRGFADPTHLNVFSYLSLKNLLTSHFAKVIIIAVTAPKLKPLADMLPGFFADDFIFICSKPI